MTDINNFYYKLFEKLNVPRANDIFHKVLFEDFEFFEKYAKTRNTDENIQKQQGGAKQTIFKNGKYTFNIYKVKDNDRISFSIHDNNNEKSVDTCMIMFIPRHEHYVYVQTISYYKNCSYPEMPKTRGGSLLLDTIIKFTQSIKDKYKLTHIQLRDTSNFTCRLDKEKTPICNLYMLTRGDTWYGKYGFVPYNPTKNEIDIDTLVDYKTNQKLVKLVKVKHTNLKEYMEKASYSKDVKGYTKQLINTIINEYNNSSLQTFFKDFISKYDTRCDMFNKIYKEIMVEVGIVDLYGKIYFLQL